MDNATSDDVRLLYAQANDNQMPLPGMQGFMGQQGVDLVELETDMASTYEFEGEEEEVDVVSPFGLKTVKEETLEEDAAHVVVKQEIEEHVEEKESEEPPVVTKTEDDGEVKHLVSNDAAAAAAETAGKGGPMTPVVSPEPEEQPSDTVEVTVSSDAAVTAVTL